MTDLASTHQTARRRELSEHFSNRFLSQPPEQIGGVKETIANYLQAFITPDIAQVFCPAANTFDFEQKVVGCESEPHDLGGEGELIAARQKIMSAAAANDGHPLLVEAQMDRIRGRRDRSLFYHALAPRTLSASQQGGL